MPDPVAVGPVPAPLTWSLRQQVLRPGRPVSDCLYPGEDDPRAGHVAAWTEPTGVRPGPGAAADSGGASSVGADAAVGAGGAVLAVGVVLPEAPPWDPDRPDGWRIRGMATDETARGQGLGSRVLALLMDHVAAHGGGFLWCNARTPALTFYQRAGFAGRGDVFDIAEIGPHRTMWRTVAATPGPPVP